ncbi:MAG TPA: hypothetical protein DD979_11610, partial [Gammaproteobacteria bacterium]|nr:hypothetical protein [Gammaproteobacteria bacterium]
PDLEASAARRGRSQSRLLLQQPQFLLFLAAIALVQSSHAVLYGFATIHWRDAGISEAAIGWLWAEGVIAEIAVFYTAAHFTRRLGPWRLLMISSMIASLRWAGLASTTTLTHLILLQWLHAFSFALSHLALVEFITRRVPASATTSAQTLVDALSLGLAFGGTMLLAGILYTAYAGGAWYLMCAMTLIALALAFLGHRRFRAVISF